MEEMQEKGSGRFKFFLLGGLLGAIGGLLFAPRSGKDTRKLISNKAMDGKEAFEAGVKHTSEKLAESKDRLAKQAREVVDKGKHEISHQKETLAAAYEAGKQAYQEEKGSVGEKKQPKK